MDQDLSAHMCQQRTYYNDSLPIYYLVEGFALLSSALMCALSTAVFAVFCWHVLKTVISTH